MALNSYFDFSENDFQYFKASYDAGIVQSEQTDEISKRKYGSRVFKKYADTYENDRWFLFFNQISWCCQL